LRVDALWKGRKMEERARIALEKSIREKWEPLACGEFESEPRCALCIEYREGNEGRLIADWCIDCPVHTKTGQKNCNGTPYKTSWIPLFNDFIKPNLKDPEVISAAKEELEFLKSLRPKEKNRPMTVVEELTEKLSTSESEIKRLRKRVKEEYALCIKWQQTADYWYNKAKEAQEVLGGEHQKVAEIWNKKQKD
jgi:hypothetical protein